MSADDPLEDLEDLYENAPCGYLSVRLDGRVFKCNRTLGKWLGYAPDEIVGKRLRDVLSVASRIFYETQFVPLLRMQGFFNEVALDLVTQANEKLPVLVNAVEKRTENNEPQFVRLTVFNATERRRYEQGLVEAKTISDRTSKTLESVLASEREDSQLREQFIAVLGHDLRNPIAAVGAGMRLLGKEPVSERGKQVIIGVQDAANRMAGLIDNIMDFARGRLGGGITLTVRPVDLTAIFKKVTRELRSTNPDRKIDAQFHLPPTVNCDGQRMGQLLSNLLGNALTHGAEGRPIRIDANVIDAVLTLKITNHGDAIPSAAMDRLFQPFFRGEVSQSQQGLGLGLHIASTIAQAHGGRIDVKSDDAETSFEFKMPISGSLIG